ncbi:DUF7455 domain-containing protein [Microbacterium esteraromaticum]|uniref:DUF7455 domain-containing protein n=1 Tax=Microbacterium esteraromaticum TaxID=57043 RepID=UPI003D3421E0
MAGRSAANHIEGDVIVYEETSSYVACDQCGAARALWVVALPSGRSLFYCGHHLDGNRTALTDGGALIYEVVAC